jgi:hypothetical protein
MLTAAALAAGLLSSALPLVASAQTTPSNTISLERYSVKAAESPNAFDASAPGMVNLSFVNRGAVAATEVRFVVENGHEVDAVIDDVGRFSPGVEINHRFQEWSVSDGASVRVGAVRYADGSSWGENDLPALRERRQSPIDDASAYLNLGP